MEYKYAYLSFETQTDWVSESPYIPFFTYKTGTGFLPTAGQYYALLTNFSQANSENVAEINFYQDNVDLSHASTLIFDYTFTYAPYWTPMPASASVTAKILFTANGTQTLWQTTIDASTTPMQGQNMVVNLPSLPTQGRLLIQLTAQNGTSTFYPTGTFGIDNIRVQ